MERENGSFDMGGCKFDVVIFSEGENEQTFAYRGDSPHIPRVSPKSLMEEGQSIYDGGRQSKIILL